MVRKKEDVILNFKNIKKEKYEDFTISISTIINGYNFCVASTRSRNRKKMEIPELQSYQQIFNHLRSVNNDVTEKYSFYKSASRPRKMSYYRKGKPLNKSEMIQALKLALTELCKYEEFYHDYLTTYMEENYPKHYELACRMQQYKNEIEMSLIKIRAYEIVDTPELQQVLRIAWTLPRKKGSEYISKYTMERLEKIGKEGYLKSMSEEQIRELERPVWEEEIALLHVFSNKYDD